jgi:cytochrome oxidase Cu insertion factor (SCO1/SenC/PrrC family)
MRVEAGDVAAFVADGALARRGEAADRAQRRRLAGAVAAEQGDDFPLADAERQTVQDVAQPVERINILYLENQAATPPR